MTISLKIKLCILDICGGPKVPEKLSGNIMLADLGYDEDVSLCQELERQIQHLVMYYPLAKHIKKGSITPYTSVNQCIQLAEKAISVPSIISQQYECNENAFALI